MINNAKTTAYLRVSTTDQDLAKDKLSILDLANDKNLGKVHFVEEKISGRVGWKKRMIYKVVMNSQPGDNLIVSELSRLGRSMMECMEILSIAIERKLNVYAVKGNWQLEDNIQSKVIAMAFSMAAEIERDLISQRTKEALRVKKSKGQKLGRPPGPGRSKLDKYKPEIEALLANGSTQKFIANRYGTTQGNLINWMKKNSIKKPKLTRKN